MIKGELKIIKSDCWYIAAIIAWNILFCIMYAYFKRDLLIDGDIVHQMTTALSQSGESLFQKDYIYRSSDAYGFYSPLQITTLKWLYFLFGNFNIPLVLMTFLYGTPMALISYCFSRRVGFSPLMCFLLSFVLCIYVSDPVGSGNFWGLYHTFFYRLNLPSPPYPAYSPYNWSLAASLYLLLLYFLFFGLEKRKQFYWFSFIAGLLFLVHAPTGLTFAIGAFFLFVREVLLQKEQRTLFVLSCIGCFLIGAAPFLINYVLQMPHQLPLSAGENRFLYEFWQMRFPDDYPRPIWKLLIRGFPRIGWIAHIFPALLTGLALVSWYKHNLRLQIGFLYGVIVYVFAFKALPYAAVGLYLLYVALDRDLEQWKLPLERLFLLTVGTFIMTTWGQLAIDLHARLLQRPAIYIENTRFMPYMGANAFLVTALLLYMAWNRYGKGLRRSVILVSLIASAVSIGVMADGPLLRAWAEDHHISYRALYKGDPNFVVDDKDYSAILDFARASPVDSLFIFLDSEGKSWYFRFRARRSIGINFMDMGIKYYSLRKELIHDWPIFTKLLDCYVRRDTQRALAIASGQGGDYLVFPRMPENERLAVQAGKSYVIIPVNKSDGKN